MISVNDVVNSAYIPLRENGGYIWGYSGGVWTSEAQKAATREQTVKWGSRWIGRRCWDCSGLWVWIFGLYGEKIYHGSNTIWRSYCSTKGKIKNGKKESGEAILPGSAVFLCDKTNNRHHIGVYVGGGKCIEAKGTYYGVVTSDISHWDEWGEIKGVDYTDAEQVVIDTATTIRLGSKGEAVKQLQNDLNRLGFNVGNADGIFGQKTYIAVREFQAYYGLKVDGIAGDETLNKIDELVGRPSDDPMPIPPTTNIAELFNNVEVALAELRKAVIHDA